jgi:hypothetical protein
MAPPKLAKEKDGPWQPTLQGQAMENWSKDREIRLVKNDGYWKGVLRLTGSYFALFQRWVGICLVVERWI